MQAYGLVLTLTNPIGGLPIVAYWPKFYSDGRETPRPYMDSKSRRGGTFMRNRQPAQDLNKVYSDRLALYSGKLLFTTQPGTVARFHMEGDFLWTEKISRKSRILRVYKLSYSRITDPLDPSVGRYRILMGIYKYSDSKDVPKVLSSCDQLIADAAPYIYPRLSEEPWMDQGTNSQLPVFDIFDYVFTGEVLPIRADFIEEYQHLGTFGSLSTRDKRAACQAAYQRAAEGIPQVTSNTFANVLEAASMLSSLLRRDFKKSKKLVGDAWLAYRYSYCTTISDVEEYKSYVQRIVDLTDIAAPPSYKCHGTFVDADGWQYHCVMRVKTSDSLPSDFSETMKAFGLGLTAVNVWDMIPYSFIVDWFLPVSDMLGRVENHWATQNLPIASCWMSVTSPKGDQYLRFPYSWDNVLPAVMEKRVSDKTLWMRVADSIALLM